MVERDDLDRSAAELPLQEWRELYEHLEPTEAGEELEACDAGTRAAVNWMQASWAGLEVPEPRVPHRQEEARAARGRLLSLQRRYARLAAAAILLLLAGGSWMLFGERDSWVEEPRPFADKAPPTVASAPQPPRVVAVGANNIEFQSGSVRLVLVTGG